MKWQPLNWILQLVSPPENARNSALCTHEQREPERDPKIISAPH